MKGSFVLFFVSTDIQMYINNSLPYGKPNAKRKNYLFCFQNLVIDVTV